MKLTSFLHSLLYAPLRLLRVSASVCFFRNRTANEAVVPEDFDWEFYLDFHSDLHKAGLRTERDAIRHYAQHGYFEKRIIRPQDETLITMHEETRLQQLKNIRRYSKQQQHIIKNDYYGRPITVSVVITLYNYADYIETCLKTVRNNTLKDIEIIIVNDASTDDSLSRCRALLSCTLPITIIDKQINTGLAHSRNLGIQQSEGDYIFILDADNQLYPQCLEEHLNTMRGNSALVACYAVIEIFDENGTFYGHTSNSPFDFKKLHSGNYIDAMAMFNRREMIAAGVYDEHLLERGIGFEDYELWLRIGRQGKPVGFIERPLSRYLKKQASMLSIINQYYHTPLMSFLRHKYFAKYPHASKTAVLVAGMHRSGTSALTGLIALLGADLGPDLIGPKTSNAKGHFEPRKIVNANDDLLEQLGTRAPGSGDIPDDWLEREETKKTKARIREIIRKDFSSQNIFVIKDPRLCLLLPLYCDLLDELNITAKVIVIRRDRQEVMKSLNERDGMPPEVSRKYYEKHIKALESNLTETESISIDFDHLIETPNTVIKQITAFIPQLSEAKNNTTNQKITTFIDPALRHHHLKFNKRIATIPSTIKRLYKKLTNKNKGPDFLIIGAQRAGTTSLYNYLCLHPQILPPAAKELHWFHAGPRESDNYHTGHKSQQWYEKQFQTKKILFGMSLPGKEKLTFEATPEYLLHPLIAKNVARLYPQTKIIVLLRDPLERAISQYYHEKKHGFIEADLNIEGYFARDHAITEREEPKLINDRDYYSHGYEHHCPISRSNYGKQLDRWLHVFPRQQILILRSEELFRTPYKILNPICNFLGIQPFPTGYDNKLASFNNCERENLSDEQKEKLASYLPFDLSIDKFCTPLNLPEP